ncbi:MAG: metallophosphoesterase [Polyangiaceae bacterium]|nr:metallophosphoesterase [Polyangiaceae bacterium]
MGFLLVAFGVAFAASAFAHLTLYRWALRSFPALGRARLALAVALALLFLWPLGRALGRTGSLPGPVRAVAQLGSTWHLFVFLAMALYGLGLLAAAGVRRASRLAASPPSLAPTEGSRELDSPSPAPTEGSRGRGSASPAPTEGSREPGSPSPASTEGSREPGSASPAPVARVGAPAVRLSRRRFVEAAGGVGALATSAGVLGWGLRVSRFDWQVEEVPVRLPRLPRVLDGFTIVQISDLHVGPLWRERELRQGLSFVASLRPDLVVVTGDIIDHDRRYVPLAARLLGSLSAREGVAFVPGNHDHYAGAREVVAGLSSAGLEALVNRGKVIAPGDGGGFALLGVDDIVGDRRGLGPDLDRALASTPEGLATVLLAHQPDFFYRTLRRGGVDVQLSGHTHGGQINPGFVPASFVYQFVAGLYERPGGRLYVNRGFGTVGPPMRVGAPPEITKLVLLAG